MMKKLAAIPQLSSYPPIAVVETPQLQDRRFAETSECAQYAPSTFSPLLTTHSHILLLKHKICVHFTWSVLNTPFPC